MIFANPRIMGVLALETSTLSTKVLLLMLLGILQLPKILSLPASSRPNIFTTPPSGWPGLTALAPSSGLLFFRLKRI
jgi:hypothetical protein